MTQNEALDILKLGHNVYLTGSAGSGKTYVLNKYIQYLREHDIEVGITASTGIAATHMNGMTIHSWCGTGIRDYLSEEEIEALEEKQYLWNRFKKTKVLIIDEVSMLGADHLTLIERVCRFFKRNDEPFGGMQIVLCGDFFQLPPISRAGEEASFVFHSSVWRDMDLKICYLHEQFRQSDEVFTKILNQIRSKNVDDEVVNILKGRQNASLKSDITPTKLFTHNIDVDAINIKELSAITGFAKVFSMKTRGNPYLVETLIKSCLAPQELLLKPGAQVMFVKNNFESGYVNGTLGTVINFEKDGSPIVRTLNGKLITATPVSWSVEEDGKVKAEIMQIPLRLAWAITVHKSQGMSLDAALVDLSKSFVPGQGYVALSRVRTLDGLSLSGFNDMALEIDENIFQFDKELKRQSHNSRVYLEMLQGNDKKEKQESFIVRMEGILEPKTVTSHLKKDKPVKVSTYDLTKKLIDDEMSLEEIAARRDMTYGTILSHVEKLTEEGSIDPLFDLAYLKPTTKQFNEIIDACEKIKAKEGSVKLTPIRNLLKNKYTFEEIRLVRLFASSKKK